ncbi:MAG: AmmeMemoRadiSam system radical SAM enzyme [Pseudomonadota bacterium]
MREAMLYNREADRQVRCNLCRHGCLIGDGKNGICNVRLNDAGTLYSIFYGKPIAMAVDPIEKKPLFHYKPGSTAFSIATPGCNFQCTFCQNSDISQYGRDAMARVPSQEVAPEAVVSQAKANHCASISYTYTEPTIFFEYACDIARLAKAAGIGNNFVTNGYMTREALDIIKPCLDAANVDLKAFRKDTYRKVMRAELDGVLDSIRYMKELGLWVEVTTLVVTGMNDTEAELSDIAKFLVGVGRDIPWHISRFVPHYKMENTPATPFATLRMAFDIGRKAGLRYVYMGNVPGDESENTYCYDCDEKLISRNGFRMTANRITNRGECPKCKAKIDGIGMGVAGK